MIVVAELKKPCSDKARADFIVENNHHKGYQIKETETKIQALDYDDSEKFENAKNAKLADLTAITSKFDNQLVNTDMIIKSSLGFTINADLRSQLNIHRLINIGVEPVSFIIADNTTVDLSLAQLNILISECEENMQHLFDLKQSYKKQIADATTKEELDAIDLQFTMKDFSKNNE